MLSKEEMKAILQASDFLVSKNMVGLFDIIFDNVPRDISAYTLLEMIRNILKEKNIKTENENK